MPLPQPQEYNDWRDWASSVLQVLQSGDAEVISGGSAGAGISYTPAGYYPLWLQTGTNDLYQGNVLGTPPTAPDIVFIDTAQIADAAIETAKIADGAVDSTHLANLAVITAKIADAAIVSAKIGDLQVVTAKIADLAVNNAKIANLAVGTANIQDAAINNAKIGALAVGTANVIDAAISTAKIANLAVGSAQIAVAAVGSAQIANASIATADIGSAQITGALIANATVLSANIGAATILGANIALGTIGSAQIGAAAIGTAQIATAAVDTLQLAGQAVTIPVSAYTPGSITLPGNTGYTVIQSCTINSTGAPISVLVSFFCGPEFTVYSTFGHSANSYNQCLWRVVRDGTAVLYGPLPISEAETAGAMRATGSNAMLMQDLPGAGTHTYTVEATTLDANPALIIQRSMQLLETKR